MALYSTYSQKNLPQSPHAGATETSWDAYSRPQSAAREEPFCAVPRAWPSAVIRPGVGGGAAWPCLSNPFLWWF